MIQEELQLINSYYHDLIILEGSVKNLTDNITFINCI